MSGRRVPEVVWQRSAGQSRVGRRRGLGQAGAPDGGRSLAQTWWAVGLVSECGIGAATGGGRDVEVGGVGDDIVREIWAGALR
jgi:hypothetical protein